MSSAATALANRNLNDVPVVWPINTPSNLYVREGGLLGSKHIYIGSWT